MSEKKYFTWVQVLVVLPYALSTESVRSVSQIQGLKQETLQIKFLLPMSNITLTSRVWIFFHYTCIIDQMCTGGARWNKLLHLCQVVRESPSHKKLMRWIEPVDCHLAVYPKLWSAVTAKPVFLWVKLLGIQLIVHTLQPLQYAKPHIITVWIWIKSAPLSSSRIIYYYIFQGKSLHIFLKKQS